MSQPPSLADRIDALLPQTQCGKCRHPGCRPYAEAIAAGEAINHCVPGGQTTIDALAGLLRVPMLTLDPDYGIEQSERRVAIIREDACIGCTKCIQACPVDAIVGAAQRMHTVIADECTGCELCIPPCPVDCIDLIAATANPLTGQAPLPVLDAGRIALSRRRFEFRKNRLAREAERKTPRRTPPPPTATPVANPTTGIPAQDAKTLTIAAAIARTALKKAQRRLAIAREQGEDFGDAERECERLAAEASALETRLKAAQQVTGAS